MGGAKHNQTPDSKKKKKSFSPSCFFYHLHSVSRHLQLGVGSGVGCGERSAGGVACILQVSPGDIKSSFVSSGKKSPRSFHLIPIFTKTMLVLLVHDLDKVCLHLFFFCFFCCLSEAKGTDRLSFIYLAADVFIGSRLINPS